MSVMGQSLPNRDVRIASVCPPISDIILRRRERREGSYGHHRQEEWRSNLKTKRDGRGCGPVFWAIITIYAGISISAARTRSPWLRILA